MLPSWNELGWWAVFLFFLFKMPHGNWFRGKVFTMPIRRRVRLLQPGFRCRVTQVLAISVGEAFLPIHRQELINALYWAPVFVLMIDDWLTGGDDGWKRFRDAVRNKVKWLMHLPPQPVEETA